MKVKIQTMLGDIVVRLYDETPIHRDEIMQMRRNRDRAGLQELQDRLAAEAEKQATDYAGLTEEQQKIYSTIGGTPHLDGQYTVFGEVEEGLDVVEMIQGTATARGDRPVDDIEMRASVIDKSMTEKELLGQYELDYLDYRRIVRSGFRLLSWTDKRC